MEIHCSGLMTDECQIGVSANWEGWGCVGMYSEREGGGLIRGGP